MSVISRVRLKPDGTRWSTGGESHTTSERGVSSITDTDAHTSAASSQL